MVSKVSKICSILLIAGGVLYIFIQFIHPLDQIDFVQTTRYKIVALLTSVMSLCIGLGILGLFFSLSEKVNLLGFIAVVIWGLFWIISMMFSFIEFTVLPLLVEHNPEFVKGMTGLFSSFPTSADLGLFPILTIVSGITYILGGILFGSYLLNTKLIPKYNGLLIIIASVITVGASAVSHPYDRAFAIPMGVALIFLGYSILKSKRYGIKVIS